MISPFRFVVFKAAAGNAVNYLELVNTVDTDQVIVQILPSRTSQQIPPHNLTVVRDIVAQQQSECQVWREI